MGMVQLNQVLNLLFQERHVSMHLTVALFFTMWSSSLNLGASAFSLLMILMARVCLHELQLSQKLHKKPHAMLDCATLFACPLL